MRLFWQTLLFWTLLGGCAAPGVFQAHGYRWFADDSLPHCTSYEWVQRDPIDVQRICQAPSHSRVIGCADVQGACLVISIYDEATADTIFLPGSTWSHRQHEVEGHIFNRWSHPL